MNVTGLSNYPLTTTGYYRADFTVTDTGEPGFLVFDHSSITYVNVKIAGVWTNLYIEKSTIFLRSNVTAILAGITYPSAP